MCFTIPYRSRFQTPIYDSKKTPMKAMVKEQVLNSPNPKKVAHPKKSPPTQKKSPDPKKVAQPKKKSPNPKKVTRPKKKSPNPKEVARPKKVARPETHSPEVEI